MADRVRLSGTLDTSVAAVTDSASTSVTLIAGVANTETYIHHLAISSGANDTITVQAGATPLYRFRMGTNSTVVLPLYPLFLKGGSGQDITIVKGTGTTPVTATALYTQENVH